MFVQTCLVFSSALDRQSFTVWPLTPWCCTCCIVSCENVSPGVPIRKSAEVFFRFPPGDTLTAAPPPRALPRRVAGADSCLSFLQRAAASNKVSWVPWWSLSSVRQPGNKRMNHNDTRAKEPYVKGSPKSQIIHYNYSTIFYTHCFCFFCPSLTLLASPLLAQPLQQTSATDRCLWKYIPAGLQPPTTHRRTSRPNGRWEPQTPPAVCFYTYSHVPFENVTPYVVATQMYAEQRRSSDNMSARSSDSDHSNMSALSRASSASRLSSTSYMSIQSERPGGRLRSVLIGCLSKRNCQYVCMHANSFVSVFFFVCLFLHANRCTSLRVCMLNLPSSCAHANI